MYKNRNLEGIKSLGYKKITKLFIPSLCSAADYGQRNRQSSFSYGKKSKNRVYKSRTGVYNRNRTKNIYIHI